MTTYNTGNPLGSTDPRDLYDNAENLDKAVNSTSETFTDRLGVARPTLSKLINEFPNVFDDAQRAEDAADAAAISEANAEEDAIATAGDRVAAETAETNAENAQLAAEAAQQSAEGILSAILLSRDVYTSTANAMSMGVADLASLVAGSGGTNGTFDIAFSGGAGTGAAGRFVVAGGLIVSYLITSTGYGYTSAPTVSFAASSGLTGASATAVIANNVDVTEYFSVPVAGTNDSLILYRVDAGPTATEITRYASSLLATAFSEVDAAVTSAVTSFGIITNTSQNAAGTTAYGIRVPSNGALRSISFRTSNSGTGSIVVARRVLLPALSHRIESITAVSPAAGVNTVDMLDLAVRKGDIIAIVMATGGGVSFTASGANGGVSIATPSVALEFKPTETTNQPSITLDLVANVNEQTMADQLADLITGEAQSLNELLETFGDVTVGAGTPTGNASSRGPVAVTPAGMLYEVRHQTTTISKLIDYNIVIYKPLTAASTTAEIEQIIPVTALTDSNGLAIATAADIGNVYVGEGRYIHVMAFTNAQGVVAYTADARQGTSATGGTTSTVGDQKAVGWFAVAYAIAFTVLKTDKIADQESIADNARFKSNLSSSIGYENLRFGQMDGEFTASTHTSKGGYVVPIDGTVTHFTASVSAAGVIRLLHLTPLTTNRYRIKTTTQYTTTVAGLNGFDVSFAAKAGDIIALVSESGGFLMNQSNQADAIGLTIDSISLPGVARVGTAYGPALMVTMRVPRVSKINATTLGGALLSESFTGTTLPTGWTQSGGWTVNNGLQSPAIGGYGVLAYYQDWSTLDRRKATMRVRVTDAASIFGLIFRQDAGSIAMVDPVANELQIRHWTPSLSSALRKSTPLTFAITAGREYILSVSKTGLSWTVSFTDCVTLQTVSLTGSVTDAYTPFNGRPGVVFISGEINVRWIGHSCPENADIRTLVLGDSNAEGSTASLAGAASWATQLKANTAAGRVLLAVQSGDPTNIRYRWPADLSRWTPRYVLISLGTNDGSHTGWRGWMSNLIAKVESLGAEPILCTVIPKTASQAIRTLMNADIKARYFGPYRFVDFASAVSTANDGVTFDPAFEVGDGVHLNAAGQNKVYQQLLADAPFLEF